MKVIEEEIGNLSEGDIDEQKISASGGKNLPTKSIFNPKCSNKQASSRGESKGDRATKTVANRCLQPRTKRRKK